MTDRKTIGREPTRRLRQLRPGQTPRSVFAQSQGHPRDRPRHARRAITHRRGAFAFDQIAARIEIDIARCRSGSHLAVINCGRAPVAQANHHKAAAAEVARRRIRDGQRKGHRNRRVHRVTAALQNIHADFGRQLICRSDHPARRAHRIARSCVRDVRTRGVKPQRSERRADEKKREEKNGDGAAQCGHES
jgi:hypothetical protein